MPLRYAATMRHVSPVRSRASLAVVGVVALLVSACGSGNPSPSSVAAPRPPPSPAASPSPAPSRSATPSTAARRRPAARRPRTAPTSPPSRWTRRSSSAACVPAVGRAGARRQRPARRRGAGRAHPDRQGRPLPEPFLDISDRIAAGGERGLLGLAFPPGFRDRAPATSTSTTRTTTATRRSRPRRPGRRPTARPVDRAADPATSRSPTPTTTAAGSGSTPTGCCCIALGDGGAGGDPENRACDLARSSARCSGSTCLGATGASRTRSRPTTRSWAAPTPARRSSTTACATRSATAFDRETGDLWIGDVGQGAWEEVDVARAGRQGPRLRLAALGGPALLRPVAAAAIPTGVTHAGHGVPARPAAARSSAASCTAATRSRRLARRATCSRTTARGRCGRSTRRTTAQQAPMLLLETRPRHQLGVDGRRRRGLPDRPVRWGAPAAGRRLVGRAGAGCAGGTSQRIAMRT